MLAVGKSGQALDVNPQQSRKSVSLGIAERRELGCDLLNRAVPLAKLHPVHGPARCDGSGGSGEPVGVQRRRQCLRAGGDVLARRGELCRVPRFEVCVAFAGELAHGIRSGVLLKKTQRRSGHVLVVTVHASVTGLGEDVCASGPAAPPPGPASVSGGVFLDVALFGEQVEVTADRGRRQLQLRGEGGNGQRSLLADHLPDPVPSAGLSAVRTGTGPVGTDGDAAVSDGHNTSVTQLGLAI